MALALELVIERLPSMNLWAMYGNPSCSPVSTTGTTLGCWTV